MGGTGVLYMVVRVYTMSVVGRHTWVPLTHGYVVEIVTNCG